MNANLAIRYGALNKILESLGMSAGDTEQCAATDGYRIDFEKTSLLSCSTLAEPIAG